MYATPPCSALLFVVFQGTEANQWWGTGLQSYYSLRERWPSDIADRQRRSSSQGQPLEQCTVHCSRLGSLSARRSRSYRERGSERHRQTPHTEKAPYLPRCLWLVHLGCLLFTGVSAWSVPLPSVHFQHQFSSRTCISLYPALTPHLSPTFPSFYRLCHCHPGGNASTDPMCIFSIDPI